DFSISLSGQGYFLPIHGEIVYPRTTRRQKFHCVLSKK
ncbi:MAG: hypothetical protein ACI8R1_001139, partial [Psychrobacter glaciei]